MMSAISNPTFKFLDEPTTGLDPLSRKRFKEMLESQKKVYRGSSVFTTHTMSEAEKICDRIAILINGSFVVVDRVENIKRMTKGFNLIVYKNSPIDLGHTLRKLIQHEAFPEVPLNSIQINEENMNRVVFGIFNCTGLAKKYDLLVSLRKKGKFKDFDLARKNLDDVILALSRFQEGDD